MQDFMNSIGPMLAVAWGFVGWKGLAYVVGGMWFGDFAGRKYPNAWQWMRSGVKKAGDSLKA